jgi:hypothetical protein
MDYLTQRISISETEFKEKFGKEVFDKIQEKTRAMYGNTCCGSGISPESAYLDDSQNLLDVHIVSVNEENPEESEAVVLSRACHTLQHIDKAIEAGLVRLCNSSLSQKELINKCRERDLLFHETRGNIKYLKLTGQEYISKLKNKTLGPNMIKFVFTDKFTF